MTIDFDILKRNMYKIDIRKAERQDVPLLLEFIRGIARYEKLENEVIASEDVPELEPAQHRLLSVAWSCTHERVDCLSTGCSCIGKIE